LPILPFTLQKYGCLFVIYGQVTVGFSDIADILMTTDERTATCPVACSASVAASATLVS
jgi:hypothetical protein